MNRTVLTLIALAAGALLVPGAAEAQHGGFGGGGGRIGGGIGGGARPGGFPGGGGPGGHPVWMPLRGGGGMGISRLGMDAGGYRGIPMTARPGGISGPAVGLSPGPGRVAIGNPGGRFYNNFGNRGDWRYGVRPPGTWGGRYPNYAWRYPYYGRYHRRYPYYGWGWGLATGALIGAATYPYYDYPYDDYPYDGYPYTTYQTPISAAAGGYCVTQVRTCALIDAAPIGTGCSCRIPGGRARGIVQ